MREAALAATALLLADPALAPAVPRYAPAVRAVLAVSVDSYYRWIARERLAAWGEDIAGLLAAEAEHDAALARARVLADDPWGEGQEEVSRWLAEQPEETAALNPPCRWHEGWTAPAQAGPYEPSRETPVPAPGARSPGTVARQGERAEWTFTPYIGVGPLHFGMTMKEITAALGDQPTVASHTQDGEDRRLDFADFTASGIRALFDGDRLGCVAVNALTGPQVRWDAAPLTGCVLSQVEDWLVRRPEAQRPGSLTYSPAGDPVSSELGLAIRSQRSGDVLLTRPLFLLHDWLDLWHSLPRDEWDYR